MDRLQSLCRSVTLVALLVAFLPGCQAPEEPSAAPEPAPPPGQITLGDIDANEPATRVRRIQPLADLLAKRLAEHDIGRGRVIVGRDIADMAKLMSEGVVDLFLDSPFPVLAASRRAGGRSLLVRQAKNEAEYWTVFIARADAGLTSVADLRGEIVVFQEPHSTSGFLLPAVHLLDQGMTLRGVGRLDGEVPAGAVGCLFSGDEENTVELIFSGRARVGVISNQDYRALPDATREQIVQIGRTDSVPRQLVAVRPGLDPELVSSVERRLLELTDSDREHMAAQDAPRGWTWKFLPLSDETSAALARMGERIDDLPDCTVQQ